MPDQPREIFGQQLAHHGHVAGHAADQLADAPRGEELDRQGVQVRVQLAPQIDHDPLAHVIDVVIADDRADGEHDHRPGQQQRDPVELAHVVVRQHGIDDLAHDGGQHQEHAGRHHAPGQADDQAALVGAEITQQTPPLGPGAGGLGRGDGDSIRAQIRFLICVLYSVRSLGMAGYGGPGFRTDF